MSVGTVPAEAVPGGALTVDQLAAAATVPRPAFPDNDVDAALAEAPAVGAPEPAPVPEPPADPVEAAAANVADARSIGGEMVTNATDKAAQDKIAADQLADFKAQHAAALQPLLDRQALHRHEAEQAVADARAKAETEPYHTYHEQIGIGKSILQGIGLILGGVSWNPAHVNRGVEQVEKNIEHDFALQKEKHAELWKRVDEAQQGVKDLDTTDLRELANFHAIQGAKLDAVAGRLAAAAAANKGKGDVTTARKLSLELSEKANTAWQQASTAEATARHQEEEDKNAAVRSKAYAAGVARKHAGGGAGGPGRADALSKFSEAAAGVEAGKPIPSEVIKYGLAAGIKPNQIATEVNKYRDAAKGSKSEIKITEDKDKQAFRDENGKVIGLLPSGKNVVKFAHDDALLTQASKRLSDLAEDIRRQHTVSSPEDVQRRAAKYANAIIAVATTSPLGKTNEAIHQEAASIGLAGAVDPDHLVESIKGILAKGGANLEAVEHKAKESIEIRNLFRKQSITPLTPEEEKHFNASKGGGGGGSHPDRILADGKTVATWNAERGGYEVKD